MYNYPIIPILVFVLMVIPPLVIAFFRGWKASLYISLITLAFVGIEIGIAFAIYDSLWNLFKGFFVGDLQPGLTQEALRDPSKASVIILFIGICMLPTYGLVMALYFPVRKLLLRHLFPKTNDINSNQKEITRSPHIASRVSGMGIAAISSLFFASSASSAAATLFTNKDNRSGFNDFTSKIANLYTFGQGKYDKNLIIARDFAKTQLTSEYQKYLSDVFVLAKKRDATINTEYNALSSGHFHNELKKLMNNPEVFQIITKLILTSDSVNGKLVDLYNMDYEERDEKGQVNGQFKSNEVTSIHTNDLLDSYSSSPSLNFNMPDASISSILNYLSDNAFVKFEDTGFYHQWQDSKNLVETLTRNANDQLKQADNLKKEFNNLKSELENIYREVNQKEARLEAIGAATNPADNTYNTIVRGNDPKTGSTVSKNILNTNGEAARSTSEIARLDGVFIAATATAEASNTVLYGTSTGSTPQPGSQQAIENDKMSIRDSAKNTLDQRKTETSDKKTIRDSIQSTLDSKRAQLQTAQNFVNNYPSLNRQLVSEKAGIEARKSTIDANVITYRNNVDSLQPQVNAEQSKYDNLKQRYDTLSQTIPHLETQLRNNSSNIADQDRIISSANGEIKKIDIELTKIQSQIDGLKPGEDSTTLQNQKTTLEGEKRTQELYITNAQSEKSRLSSERATLEPQLTQAKAEIANVKPDMDNSLVTLNKLKNSLSTNTNNYNMELAKQINVDNELRDKEAEIQRLKTKHDNTVIEMGRLTTEIGDSSNGLIKDLSDANHQLRLAETSENNALNDYNNKLSDYNSNHSNNYLPALNKQKLDEAARVTAEKNLNNEKQHLADLEQERRDIISELSSYAGPSGKWASKLNDMQTKADEINDKEYRDHTDVHDNGESFVEGTPKDSVAEGLVYKPKTTQTADYYNWAFGTTIGAKDYLEKGKSDLNAFDAIKTQAEIEYNKLKNKYLETVKTLLKS